jgi:hypothetical protein
LINWRAHSLIFMSSFFFFFPQRVFFKKNFSLIVSFVSVPGVAEHGRSPAHGGTGVSPPLEALSTV